MANTTKPTHSLPTAEEFVQLLGYITEKTGIHAVVLDAKGNLLHEAAPRAQHCETCHGPENACCKKTQRELYTLSLNEREPVVGKCAAAGLDAVALPVYIGEKRVATWVLCQFRYTEEAENTAHNTNVPHMNQKTLQFLQLLITSLCQPIVRLRQYNRELEAESELVNHLAYTDLLLDLPNRNALQQDLARGAHGSLLILEVRELARVNAAYGRASGDALLRNLRDALLALNLPGGKLYRLSASCFGLWDSGWGKQQLMAPARQLLAYCAAPEQVQPGDAALGKITFTAAVGILPLADLPGATIEDIEAAIAYITRQAAQTGDVVVFDKQKSKSHRRRLELEVELPEAVRQGMRGFRVVYQPIIDPANALWKGVEALCRWESAKHGSISPEEFIPILEGTGLIGDVGLWVLDTATREMLALSLTDAEQFKLDVNLSPLQLADSELASKVLATLAQNGYPPDKLCLEITESASMDFSTWQLEALQTLRATGITFALDDFGVGYASLSSLYRLPVSVIKTDRSLVQDVENNSFLQRLFYVMGELAHVNGMKIVAEGVEEHTQAKTLLMEGADFFQGYLFSRPLDFDRLRQMKGRFYTSSITKPRLQYSRADLNIDPRGGNPLPPRLYNILNHCMHILFTDTETDRAINRVLKTVGEALDVSRAYVYMRGKGDIYNLTHIWSAPGVIPLGEDVLSTHMANLGPTWLQELLMEDMFVAADISVMPEKMHGIMERYGVKAFAEFSLLLDGNPVGTVNFNDCNKVRYWAKEDIRMLQLLANMLAGALSKTDLRNQLARQKDELQRILDKIDALVYVTEPENGKILFANRKTRDTFAIESLEGLKCWETLQGQGAQCAFCPYEKLRENPDEIQHYELFNEPLGDFLQIGASTIEWEKGHNAVLFSAFNINDLVNRQHWLEITASTDPLTGVHNRRSFLDIAEQMLKNANGEGKPATLAFLDVDGLKRENDLRGHRGGDALLCNVVHGLQGKTRSTDLIGRIGGDEFVVLFYDCTRENAARSLEKTLAALAELDEPEIYKYHRFSYGLVDTRTVPYQAGRGYLEELLSLADDEMRVQKHLHRAGSAG